MVQCLIGGMIMQRYIYALEPARSIPAARSRPRWPVPCSTLSAAQCSRAFGSDGDRSSAVSHTWSGPRHRVGFWAVAYAFLVLFAFSTAPRPLYVLYARRDHFSSFMITLIYATYAIGVVASLFFVSHLSDHHGRRPHLLADVAFAVLSDVLFLAWTALPGLFLARILCGISVGLTVSTATAHLNELHQARRPGSSRARRSLVPHGGSAGPQPGSSPAKVRA
jgi:ABC-type sugar transport system permease subunit